MNNDDCCPKFDPEPWNEKEIVWENKLFVVDRVRSFLHIPLNFPSVMKRIMKKMEAANVKSEDMVVLADEDCTGLIHTGYNLGILLCNILRQYT